MALACALAFSAAVSAQSAQKTLELQILTEERQILSAELEQYQKSLAILHSDQSPPEQSPNPAIRKLAREVVSLKQRLIEITEKEVTLLQEQIVDARSRVQSSSVAQATYEEAPPPAERIESKPLRVYNVDYTRAQETENVERLHQLLEIYYADLQASAAILPTEDEVARREIAQRDADTLARIPFSVDKVRLNGSEGSTALAQISRRLTDPTIPESRRDIAPIFTIKTRLFDTLVGSESRSLQPVGKNHYIARIRLQPGETTLSILSNRWDIRLPQHANAGDFLVTFYRPPGGSPELHIFAIEDLLAADNPHIPAWLPNNLDIATGTG